MTDPAILGNPEQYKHTATEHSELEEVVSVYRMYKVIVHDRDEAREMLDRPLEEEFRELVKEEYHEKAEQAAALEEQLRILLVPKDPNDNKNVIVEIRGGAGGEEAALFAAVLFRMYVRYAERSGWHVETVDINETEIGGVKECTFTVIGAGAYSRLKFDLRIKNAHLKCCAQSYMKYKKSSATAL